MHYTMRVAPCTLRHACYSVQHCAMQAIPCTPIRVYCALQDHAMATFLSMDGTSAGRLEPYELLEVFRNLAPKLSPQQLRYVVFYVRE